MQSMACLHIPVIVASGPYTYKTTSKQVTYFLFKQAWHSTGGNVPKILGKGIPQLGGQFPRQVLSFLQGPSGN